MKFVIISNDIFTVLNFRFDFIKKIQTMNNEVYILAPNIEEEAQVCETLEKNGFIIRKIFMDRAGTNPISDIRTIQSIYHALKEINPDIVFSYTIKPVIYGTIAASILGVSNIYALICGLGNMFQDIKKDKFNFVNYIVNKLYKVALCRCNKVFFQNHDDLDLLYSLKILDNKNKGVVVNGSGINLNKFTIDALKCDGQGNIKASFIMVARLLRYKGVYEYVEAARILKRKYPNAEFHLVGDRDENPASISSVDLKAWTESEFIKCWGRLQDVRPALQQANIFVLPSYYREGIPRSILEAMSMGKAIITTDNVGCRETVEEGKNGYLVQPKDVNSLVLALEKLILQPKLIKEMAKYSRILAEQKFDVTKINQSMINQIF